MPPYYFPVKSLYLLICYRPKYNLQFTRDQIIIFWWKTENIRQNKWALLIWVYTDTTASNYTFMMSISCSITPQRGSVELRNSGAHLSTVNPLSLSRNQIKMIWTLLHGALSYCKLWLVQCGHGVDIVNSNAAVLQWCSVGGKRPKVYQHPYTNTSRMKCWYKTGWIIAFMLFMPKSDLTLALISVSCS